LATYNELGGWTEKDERDLYTLLVELNNKNVRFALSNVLAHKGESNEIMKSWVKNNNFVVHKLNYNYKNSNYHSSAKNNTTSEVLVTNY
jgi:site-specific DNA-adenine methylase